MSPPEAAMAEFKEWADGYGELSPARKAEIDARGVELGKARCEAMKVLLRTDPKRAI